LQLHTLTFNFFVMEKAFLGEMKSLSRNEMKKVMGGVVAGTCQSLVNGVHFVNMSKSEALQTVAGGGRWCCDSCGSASWAS
jgi:hypothetical protein